MAILCQGTGVAFVVAAADVIQHQGAFLEVAGGEFFLDAPLSLQQPVHGLIQVVFGSVGDSQLLGQGGAVPAGGGQSGSGIEQALDDHGQDQIALATRLGGNHGIQPELTDGPQDGFDVTVRKSFFGGEQILGRDQMFILQEAAEGLDFLLGASERDWRACACGSFCPLARLRGAGWRAGGCGWGRSQCTWELLLHGNILPPIMRITCELQACR